MSLNFFGLLRIVKLICSELSIRDRQNQYLCLLCMHLYVLWSNSALQLTEHHPETMTLWSLWYIPLTLAHMVWACEHAGDSVELCDSGHVPAMWGPQVRVWVVYRPTGKSRSIMQWEKACNVIMFLQMSFQDTVFHKSILTLKTGGISLH